MQWLHALQVPGARLDPPPQSSRHLPQPLRFESYPASSKVFGTVLIITIYIYIITYNYHYLPRPCPWPLFSMILWWMRQSALWDRWCELHWVTQPQHVFKTKFAVLSYSQTVWCMYGMEICIHPNPWDHICKPRLPQMSFRPPREQGGVSRFKTSHLSEPQVTNCQVVFKHCDRLWHYSDLFRVFSFQKRTAKNTALQDCPPRCTKVVTVHQYPLQPIPTDWRRFQLALGARKTQGMNRHKVIWCRRKSSEVLCHLRHIPWETKWTTLGSGCGINLSFFGCFVFFFLV